VGLGLRVFSGVLVPKSRVCGFLLQLSQTRRDARFSKFLSFRAEWHGKGCPLCVALFPTHETDQLHAREFTSQGLVNVDIGGFVTQYIRPHMRGPSRVCRTVAMHGQLPLWAPMIIIVCQCESPETV
jgi:hypothetical protein